MDLRFSKKSAPLLFLSILVGILVLSYPSVNAQPMSLTNDAVAGLLAAPTVANGSFESSGIGNNKTSISGWSVSSGDVDVLSGSSLPNGASDGIKYLDLANATISQTVTGFSVGETYVLRIDYRGNTSDGAIKDAKVIIDGVESRQGLFGFDPAGIHSKEENDWIICNGFQFVPDSASVEIQIESEESGGNGLLIDNVRITQGAQAQPPVNVLSVNNNWVSLTNGNFQQTPSSPLIDPQNTGPSGNPHVCGDAIPGWLVTRENVDMVNGFGVKSNGDWVTDTGGHGPGSLAHTIAGLAPNATYTLEFEAAMHIHWGPGPMRSGFVSNGEFIKEIVRTSSQEVDDGPYPKEQIDLVSDADGKITFEIYSTHVDLGGNIAYDNFRIRKKQDAPQLTNPTNQSNNDGDAVSFTVLATDSDGDNLTFSATGLPTGLSIEPIDASSARITGTITAAGTFDVEVTVSDGGRSDSAEFEWFVNALPNLDSIADQTTNLNESVSLTASATDPNDDPISYSAIGLPTGLSINEESGLISGVPTAAGDYIVEVVATDDLNGQDSVTFSWIINSSPVLAPIGDQLTEPEGSVNLELSAEDSDGDQLNFASTGLPDGLNIDPQTGKITGIVTKRDNYSVKVTVTDGLGGEDSETFMWAINTLPTVNSPGNQKTEEGVAVSLIVNASDPDNDPLDFSATGLPSGLAIDQETGMITGTPTTAGMSTVTVTVADSFGGMDSISIDWEVFAKSPPTGEGDHFIFLPLVVR